MKRRNFIAETLLTAGSSILLPAQLLYAGEKSSDEEAETELGKKEQLRIGIFADIHLDLMPDGERRLQLFMEDMKAVKPDFIIQLGDFCSPHEKNIPLVNLFNSYGPSYHVIGNHDTDYDFTHEQVVAFLKMKGTYYSFDRNGHHIVVLNGNERMEGDTSRWPSYVGKDQLDWLEKDLDSTNLPVLIFCHQGMDVNIPGSMTHGSRVRVVLERANKKAGFTKVQVVFSGHHHQDYHNIINGIHYIQINSMSYYWMGSQYRKFRFTPEIDKKYPWVKDTAPYKDPIWAVLNIYKNGKYELKGRTTEFIAPSPADMGMAEFEKIYPVTPIISDRIFKVT